MKHLKFFSLLMCCLMAGVLTSCVSDEESSDLTPTQRHQAFQQVSGSYSGKVMFYDASYSGNTMTTTNTVDTLDANFILLTDSTASISRLPIAALAHQVKDETLRNAMLKSSYDNTALSLVTYYYNVTPAACQVAAKPLTLNLEYGGSTHQVTFVFYYGYSSAGFISYGMQNTKTGDFYVRLQLGGLKIDDKDETSNMLFNDNVHGVLFFSGHR